MVAVGVCGTRFARTVLALFPPSSLRLHRPIKAESGDLACILTPSPCGHSPYIPCRNTGEKGNTRFGNEVEFYCFVTPRHVTGHGRGRRLNTNDFLSPPKIVSDARDALRLFILLSSEKNEPRSAAAVIGLLGLSLWSPSGSAELASLGQSSPFFLRLPCDFTAR